HEIAGETADLGLVENGGNGAKLFFGGEDRAANEALQILGAPDQRFKARKIFKNLVDGLGLVGKLEQSRRIAAGHACRCGVVCGHEERSFVVSSKNPVSGVGALTSNS